MLIEYTSAREHRPTTGGANLAPSLNVSNWTVVGTGSKSNDAAGNLVLTWVSGSSTYIYASITVEANASYRVRVTTPSDYSGLGPTISVGTSAGDGRLSNYEGRDGTPIDVDVVVKPPSTALVISMYLLASSAAYCKMSSVTVEKVTTLTHAPGTRFLNDNALHVSGMYTAVSASLGGVSIFGLASAAGDNSLSVTNSGAVNGRADLTQKFPTVSGRKFKASTLWIPHDTATGYLFVGTTAGGTEYANVSLNADIDAANPFFTVGTDSSGNALRWDFTNSNNGWTRTNCNEALSATYIGLTATASDPQFRKTGLSFSGYQNRYVIAWARRTSAAWSQQNHLFFTTAAHGESTSYYAAYAGATLAQVASGSGARTMIVWDMWQLAAGGDDWKNSTITGLRPDINDANGATWEIDLIAVGNLNPLEAEVTATDSNGALISLRNSSTNNATSYYILPHVEQIDSLYTLEQAGSAASQPNRRKIGGRNISEDGVNEWGYIHRIEKHWEIVTDEVEGTAYDDWNEFLESVSNSEVFTIDVKGTAASPNDPRLAVLADDTWDSPRVNNVDKWRFRFRVRFLPR